jgi:predicted flap endonuclease-1-like 5' DNA nuclease
MIKKHSLNFMIGLLLGCLVGAIIWYWQKSTSAENGALTLLDRLAETDKRLRQTVGQVVPAKAEEPPQRYVRLPHTAVTSDVPPFLANLPVAESADDLMRVKGIGPVFAARLQEAGVQTLAQVTAVSAARLADMLDVPVGRAEDILAAAVELANQSG